MARYMGYVQGAGEEVSRTGHTSMRTSIRSLSQFSAELVMSTDKADGRDRVRVYIDGEQVGLWKQNGTGRARKVQGDSRDQDAKRFEEKVGYDPSNYADSLGSHGAIAAFHDMAAEWYENVMQGKDPLDVMTEDIGECIVVLTQMLEDLRKGGAK